MEYSIEVVNKGSRILEIGPKEFMDYVNPIIAEKAFILMQEQVEMEGEKKWIAATAAEVDNGTKLFVLAWSGKRMVGNCHAMMGDKTGSKNLTFGITISKDFRGHGLGRKLLMTAIEEGKKAFSPHKITIDYIGGNEVAKALYESLGFREVCRIKDYHFHYGVFRDKVMLELEEK